MAKHLDQERKELGPNQVIENFHDLYARQPPSLVGAREGHGKIITRLLDYIKTKEGIENHREHVGSSYEGVKVAKGDGNDDLEFDVLIILKVLPKELKVDANKDIDLLQLPGHVYLNLPDYSMLQLAPGQRKSFLEKIICTSDEGNSFLNAPKTIDCFTGMVQRWLNSSEDLRIRTLLRRHGPAVQMDVYEKKVTSDRPYYSVDLVPAIEIEVDGQLDKIGPLYVAKPVKNRSMPDSASWRLLSDEEIQCRGNVHEKVNELSSTHIKYMLEFEKQLELLGKNYKISFTGHNLIDETIEFKIVVVDRSHDDIEKSLIEGKQDLFRLASRKQNRLDARKETTTLENDFRSCIQNYPVLKDKVHVRRDGPVIRLLVCKTLDPVALLESSSKETITPVYYVEVVLAYQHGNCLFVAKPKEEPYPEKIKEKVWRRSFAVQIKRKLKGKFDCLKMVLRILKVLVRQNTELAFLSSYHLKTVMLWLKKDLPEGPEPWKKDCLAQRLIDALMTLESRISLGDLRDYYLRDVNLLSNMAVDCKSAVSNRLRQICKSEKDLCEFFNVHPSRNNE